MKTIIKIIVSLLSLAIAPLIAADPKDRTVAEHAGKLDKWFTLEEAAKIIGKPAAEAQVEYTKSEKHPYTEVVDYSWQGGRKRMTTGALKMEIPVPDSIKVGWLRKDTPEQLKALREMTEAEDIADLGELAFLVKSDQQYIIYKNGVRFSIWINISDDAKVNRAKALEIAQLLLAKI
jgi:hypothetical protein